MRIWAGVAALLGAGLPALAWAQVAAPASPAPAKEIVIGRVTISELKTLMEADKVLVVDVRSADAYKGGHIPGAVSAPLSEIDKHVEKLKAAQKQLVTYCT
jgi:3-mercaptopyruvate sulfurtransferase SseA